MQPKTKMSYKKKKKTPKNNRFIIKATFYQNDNNKKNTARDFCKDWKQKHHPTFLWTTEREKKRLLAVNPCFSER